MGVKAKVYSRPIVERVSRGHCRLLTGLSLNIVFYYYQMTIIETHLIRHSWMPPRFEIFLK